MLPERNLYALMFRGREVLSDEICLNREFAMAAIYEYR
jgi:hypothetical protein